MTPARLRRHPLAGLILILAAQAIILSTIRSGTSYDGAEQLLYSQYWDWGYGRSQPPLYTWLLKLLQIPLGISQLAENLLKFGLLALGLAGMLRLAGHLGYARQAALAVMSSLLLVQDIFWELQRNYSHTALLVGLLPWVTLAWLRLADAQGTRPFAWLGFLSGLLILSKYNSGLFLAALIGADLLIRRRESVLKDPRMGLALAAALIVIAPHLLWASQNTGAVTALSSRFEMQPQGSALKVALQGAAGFAGATLGVFILPILIAAALLRGQVPALIRQPRSIDQRLMLTTGLLFLAFWLAALLGSSSTRAISRWFLPAAVPLLPVLIGGLCQLRPHAARRVIGAALILFGLGICVQWLYSTRINARMDYDYAALAEHLSAGTKPQTILLSDYAIFANLRLYDPKPAYAAPPMPKQPRGIALPAILVGEAGSALDLAHKFGLCPNDAEASEFAMPRHHKPEPLNVTILPLMACPG